MQNTLIEIARKLNNEQIIWGIGGSILLKFYNLIDDPGDIDIIVDLSDIESIDIILKDLGHKIISKKSSLYSSKYYFKYKINEIDVDVMAGFVICYNNKQYQYDFNEKSIIDIKSIENVEIPLTPLEDWYVLYSLMKREKKVKIIEQYFRENGIKNHDILEKYTFQDIPQELRTKILNLLSI